MKKKWWRLALALALTAGILAPLTAKIAAAEFIDWGKTCSLTVTSLDEFKGDLKTAGLVVDLYKVAEAVPDPSYDTYSYRVLEPYADQGFEFNNIKEPGIWRELAQETAAAVLEKKIGKPVVEAAGFDSRIDLEEGGLYLMVARGSDIGNYVTRSGNGSKVVTVAKSRRYSYTFEPELISLPTKEAQNGSANTANTGDWVYDLTVTLKAERTLRYGSLEIVKSLLEYDTKSPATVEFTVDVQEPYGGPHYTKKAAVTFTEAGQRSVRIDKLPVDTVVKVTETYMGSSYTLASSSIPEGGLTIAADTAVEADFSNTYTREERGGYGVTNHFAYEAGRDAWTWTQTGGAGE